MYQLYKIYNFIMLQTFSKTVFFLNYASSENNMNTVCTKLY